MLTRERANLGTGGTFTIFDQGDSLGCVKELLSRIDYGKRFDAGEIVTRISNAKNAFLLPEELPDPPEPLELPDPLEPPELPEAPILKDELRDFNRKVSQAGHVTYGARGGILGRSASPGDPFRGRQPKSRGCRT